MLTCNVKGEIMLKAVLFDLDGTLLPMNEENFTKGYFSMLCQKLAPFGYNSEELINVILAGSKQMIKNDGSRTNEQAFWDCFVKNYGEEKLKDKNLFADFYRNEFKATKKFCGENKEARDLIDFIKSHGLKIILASNPLFPRDGMISRLGFIGLVEDDFNYITSYETLHFTKPNPNFYQEILKTNHLNANEVIFIGNSETEDREPANKVGIKTFLIGSDINFSDIKHVIENEMKK